MVAFVYLIFASLASGETQMGFLLLYAVRRPTARNVAAAVGNIEHAVITYAPWLQPFQEALRQANRSENEGFAILSKGERVFLQAARSAIEGYCLEYNEGSKEHILHATDEEIPLEQIIKAFQQSFLFVGDSRTRK